MISATLEIAGLLAADAPVAIGVSGGKDSCALAFATVDYLDSIGHRGPRVLVHSDLGRVEWRASLPTCERLAAKLGLELITVRRGAGDMMDRWLTRWENNVERYRALSCVRTILPWSTPDMRFCTSELKTAVICRELIKRFPGRTIISCAGIRRDESAKRKLALVAKPQPKLTGKRAKTNGVDWNPIIYLAEKGFELHEAYTKYGMTRVSCAFCIMGSEADIVASTTCPDNADIYREMVQLEIDSTFAFQGDRWLGDVAPQLLTEEMRAALIVAKERAVQREEIEARIPEHLLYTKGWPTVMPTAEEAELIASVRRDIAALMGFEGMTCTTAAEVTERYAGLMAARAAKDAAKAARAAKSNVVAFDQGDDDEDEAA